MGKELDDIQTTDKQFIEQISLVVEPICELIS